MAWADIAPAAEHFAGEEVFLRERLKDFAPETDEKRIYLAEAKAVVLRDIGVALQLNPEATVDMTTIETAITDRGDWLRWAIAYKQLELLYTRYPGGEGELNEVKRATYAKKYLTEQRGFIGLRSRSGRATAQSVPIRR